MRGGEAARGRARPRSVPPAGAARRLLEPRRTAATARRRRRGVTDTTRFRLERAGDVALVRIENDDERPTVFSRGAMESLLGVLDELEHGDWRACVITGKPGFFEAVALVGAPPERVRPDVRGMEEVIRRARSRVDDVVHGATPAPYRALELIAGSANWSLEDGYRAEEEAIGDLLPGRQAQASIYAFDVVERRAKRGVR